MTKTSDIPQHISLKYGLTSGIELAFKLAVGYAAFLALLFALATLNPIIFLLTFLFAFTIGIIPSLVIGGLAGLFFSIVFERLGKSLSEWKIVGFGWVVGIICAFLMVITVGLILSDGDLNIPEFGWVLMCPGLVTLFAIGWLARKIGEPYL